MAFHYVVAYRGSLYGPFVSRMEADAWISEHAARTTAAGEIASWEVRGLMHPGLTAARRSDA